MKRFMVVGLAACCLAGCVAPVQQAPQENNQQFTLGLAQSVVKKGMSQADVVKVLGSPNLVTRDKMGVDTWVYDRTSYEVASTGNSAYGTLILVGGRTSSSNYKSTQRTLTLILKFKDAVLDEFTYNATSF